ncbi:class A beta-lactamase-related serine hydrolase [Segetibacter sp. 3557_3]|uniref:serine hydrolase domain-containing protein n=1 Tax=Segetibacter sp. 3557_3 TaxID=2547429 RepID=UPI00105840CA|nr:serine hydrolase domain-containing protein [Segetibacter sp. 3557_3]TDH23510.1 class A beta-lactamase-related serine hydrolase [Segetibacter sp. 3557_3]
MEKEIIAPLSGINLSASTESLRTLNISEDQLRAHTVKLPSTINVRTTDDNVSAKVEDSVNTRSIIAKKFAPPVAKAAPAFNANYFGPIVHELIHDKVMGYMYQVYKGSSPIFTGIWNWAKNPNDGAKGWTADTRMHVASVSKLMTAIGLVKLLDKKGISLDTSINAYLPTYWNRGNGVAGITFRKLLNHTSGFSGENSRCDYAFMKEQVAKGPNVAAGTYANVNFSIMRVIITIIDGRMQANSTYNLPFTFPGLLDSLWDLVCTKYFQEYMNREVFSDVGLPTIGFTPGVGGPTAKAYSSPTDPEGRDGDWSTVSGGAGFYMSVTQILKTLDGFRNGDIIPAARAQYMLDNNLGHNGSVDTAAGKVYVRLGGWSINGGEEQAAVYCLPNNVNIALLINSPVKGFVDSNGKQRHVHGLILPAIEASIH